MARYEGHVPPFSSDMVAALGDVTACHAVARLHQRMLSDATGRRLLRERPRVSSQTVNRAALRALPATTMGYTYAAWMDAARLSPDTRTPVRHVDHEEWAYVLQRYRESHDFYHALTGLPATVEGEIALKWFEWCNLGLPVAALSACFGPLRLSAVQRRRIWTVYVPWAVWNGRHAQSMINVYWEEEWMTNVNVLRHRLRLQPAPFMQSRVHRLKVAGDR